MNITIKAENAVDLDFFNPVSGTWSIEDKRVDDTINDVEESILNWMGVSYPIDISVFQHDGRKINGYLPWEGSFLAIRK